MRPLSLTFLQFYTYAAYFFQTAGIADPFAVTCITNGVQLVIILIVAASVDRFGRRRIACGGLTTMWAAVTLIGILGVAPDSSASDALLVFFSCIFSGSHSPSSMPIILIDRSRWPAVLGIHRLGFRWRNLFTATATVHCRFRCGHLLRRRSHHERTRAVHVEREPVELGSQDSESRFCCGRCRSDKSIGILLHGLGCSICCRSVVHHSRASWVSTNGTNPGAACHVLMSLVVSRMPSSTNCLKRVSSRGVSTRPRPLCSRRSRRDEPPRTSKNVVAKVHWVALCRHVSRVPLSIPSLCTRSVQFALAWIMQA